MKINFGTAPLHAMRDFTDREEPRKIFWDQYEALCNDTEQNVRVLTYYGIGGIGKSRLLDKLQEEMEEQLSTPYYAEIDLKTYQDSRITLYNLRNKLSEKYNFHFPGFDMGYYVYLQRIGENKPVQESQLLTEKSTFLNCLKTACGLVGIPVVNIAAGLFEIAEKSAPEIKNYIQKHLKKYKNELLQIEIKSTDKLLEYLPHLFAIDLANNLTQPDKKFVFFIDTYEMLVNELMQTGDPLQNDVWIRDTLVRSIPNVLWVIAGREKLKWEKFDPQWKEAIQQVLLGSFSPADSNDFLEKEGVADAELRSKLCELTKGTPIYLNLCVDQYHSITEAGLLPEISMFGNDLHTLVECFVRYMGDAQKDLVYMLSCIQLWNDEEIDAVAEKVLPNFSISAYEKVTGYSFVSRTDNGYSLHQTVGDVLLQNCPRLIKHRAAEALFQYAQKILESSSVFEAAYARALAHTLRTAMVLYPDREKLCEFYKDSLQEKLWEFADAGFVERSTSLIESLLFYCGETKDHLYLCAMSDKAYILDVAGQSQQAETLSEEFIELSKEILGEDHPDTLNSMNNLASYYDTNGKSQKALELQLIVWEKQKELFGENHKSTLNSLHNLATYYDNVGNYKKALELEQTAWEKQKETLGEDHPLTLNSLHNLATYYDNVGNYKKALELKQTVWEKQKEILGEHHPLTLNTLNGLASFHDRAGNPQKALEIQIAVLTKRKEILGEDHPDTVSSLHNLASYYDSVGDLKKALEIQETVWEKRKTILGEDHPDTLTSLNNLATYYDRSGNSKKAMELEQIVWEKQKEVLGEDHPDTLSSLHNLAAYYFALGDGKTATELLQQVYAKRCALLGETNPNSIRALKDLISLAQASGNRVKEVLYKNKLKSLKRK